MEDPEPEVKLELLEYAEPISGRKIHGALDNDRGGRRWAVETRGPAFKGIHLQVWRFAGKTLAEAQQLAEGLGPMSEMDETELVNSIVKN
jgi:hypothetical protein